MEIKDLKVLVIEDVHTVRHHLKDILRSAGFQDITSVANAEEAKQKLELETFHLVLSDYMMTPTTGYDLLCYLRQHDTYAKVPFVMITADNTKENVIHSVQSGVDDYVIKPLTPQIVRERVFQILKKKKVIS